MPERSWCPGRSRKGGRAAPRGNLECSIQKSEAECVTQVGENQDMNQDGAGGDAASPGLRDRLGFWLGWNMSLVPVR